MIIHNFWFNIKNIHQFGFNANLIFNVFALIHKNVNISDSNRRGYSSLLIQYQLDAHRFWFNNKEMRIFCDSIEIWKSALLFQYQNDIYRFWFNIQHLLIAFDSISKGCSSFLMYYQINVNLFDSILIWSSSLLIQHQFDIHHFWFNTNWMIISFDSIKKKYSFLFIQYQKMLFAFDSI
jgi:hypothetical protein